MASARILDFFGLLLTAGLALAPVQAAAQATGYDQPFRPQVHFSPQRNWTNDPNGLVYFRGEYHLFFQYNPFGDQWGHMSWGHAVSKDLLHWHELPVAIPEEGNTMIFTGSVVVDRGNTSGLCAPGSECLVAVYTGYTQLGDKKTLQTQNLAYSRDKGRTWTKYTANPVLDLNMADFRDPSVSWNEATHTWVMAVSLPREHKVRFYASPDLKHWTQLSDFGPLGDTAGDWECPDLLHIPADSGKGPGTWALKVGLNPGGLQGGSGEQYFLGGFDGKQFTASTAPGAHGWTNYGKDDYCAISFNNLSPAEKPTLIGWMNNWQYAAKLPTSPWRGQMSLPRRLSFIKDNAGSTLRQEPVTAPLRIKHIPLTLSLGATRQTLPIATEQAPYELLLRFPNTPDHTFGIRLHSDAAHYTEIGFDGRRHTFYTDRTHSGQDIAPDFPGRVDAATTPGRPYDLHLVVDRSSVESFAQDGTIAMTDLIFPSTDKASLELFTDNPESTTVSADLWTLQSIW